MMRIFRCEQLKRVDGSESPHFGQGISPTVCLHKLILTNEVSACLWFVAFRAKLIGQPTVLNVINSMRKKCGKPPLVLAPDT